MLIGAADAGRSLRLEIVGFQFPGAQDEGGEWLVGLTNRHTADLLAKAKSADPSPRADPGTCTAINKRDRPHRALGPARRASGGSLADFGAYPESLRCLGKPPTSSQANSAMPALGPLNSRFAPD